MGDTLPVGRQTSLPREDVFVMGTHDRTSPGGGTRVGLWEQEGMQGKEGSKDALARLSPGHPPHLLPHAQPRCQPSQPCIPPKPTPKPKSVSHISAGLAPALLLVLLFGGGIMVPWESFGERPFTWGHGVTFRTRTFTQC